MDYNVSKCQQNDTRAYEGCKEDLVISNKPNTCLKRVEGSFHPEFQMIPDDSKRFHMNSR